MTSTRATMQQMSVHCLSPNIERAYAALCMCQSAV